MGADTLVKKYRGNGEILTVKSIFRTDQDRSRQIKTCRKLRFSVKTFQDAFQEKRLEMS